MALDMAPHLRGIAHQSFCCRINLLTVRFVFAAARSNIRGGRQAARRCLRSLRNVNLSDFQDGEESLPEPNNRAVPDSLL